MAPQVRPSQFRSNFWPPSSCAVTTAKQPRLSQDSVDPQLPESNKLQRIPDHSGSQICIPRKRWRSSLNRWGNKETARNVGKVWYINADTQTHPEKEGGRRCLSHDHTVNGGLQLSNGYRANALLALLCPPPPVPDGTEISFASPANPLSIAGSSEQPPPSQPSADTAEHFSALLFDPRTPAVQTGCRQAYPETLMQSGYRQDESTDYGETSTKVTQLYIFFGKFWLN